MSHRIPSYSRFVTSVTITATGSGYASPPAITFTSQVGDPGSGAAATATIVNGQLNSITMTNGGSGYLSAPTITIAPPVSGTTATATAITSFAALPPTDHEEKSKIGISNTIPEFIREDYPQFVTFLEKYYEFLDEEGNPGNILFNKHFYDIDDLNNSELNKKALELAKDFPQVLQIDRATFYKNIKDIYATKGSQTSIKTFFKVLYNEEVQISYPSESILRASDGVWKQESAIKVINGYDNYVASQTTGLIDIVYYRLANYYTDEFGDLRPNNIPVLIKASIDRILPLEYTAPQAYDVFIKKSAGVISIPGPGVEAAATATVSGGVITSLTATNSGTEYTAAPEVVITDDTGSGADIIATVVNGEITGFTINSGGSGYTSPTVEFNTDSVRTFITNRNLGTLPINSKGFLIRVISSVSTDTYAGSAAGFSIGDIFKYAAPSSGDISYFKVSAISSLGVPTAWKVVTPGSGYTTKTIAHTVTSKTGVTINLTLSTSFLFDYPGKYISNQGMLSNSIKLQDNYKYQNYSYIIKSSLPQYQWNAPFRKHIHPAGKEVFGDLVLRSELNVGVGISITQVGMHLFDFITEEVLYTTEIIAKDIGKPFTDTYSISDIISIEPGKYFIETATANDAVFQNYGEEGYFPETYVGNPGVIKFIGKNPSDIASTTEVFERVVTYNLIETDITTVTELFVPSLFMPRAYNDSVTMSDGLLIGLGYPRSFIDSISSIAETIVFDTGMNTSDSATTSQTIGINIYKELVDPIGFEDTPNPIDSISIDTTWSRDFTESASVADSGFLTLLNYIDLTYFAEDYVGETITIT